VRLDISRVEDPETGEVHAAWLWGRETLCGIKSTHWERQNGWRAPIECDECCRWFLGVAMEEAAIELGRRMKNPKKVTT